MSLLRVSEESEEWPARGERRGVRELQPVAPVLGVPQPVEGVAAPRATALPFAPLLASLVSPAALLRGGRRRGREATEDASCRPGCLRPHCRPSSSSGSTAMVQTSHFSVPRREEREHPPQSDFSPFVCLANIDHDLPTDDEALARTTAAMGMLTALDGERSPRWSRLAWSDALAVASRSSLAMPVAPKPRRRYTAEGLLRARASPL